MEMTRIRFSKRTAAAAGISWLLALSSALGAAAAPLTWSHHPADCVPPDDTFSIACGELGTFSFGPSSLPSTCPGVVGNTEDVPEYPPPREFVLDIEKPLFGERFGPVEAHTAQGRPARAPDPQGDPWALLIDWPTWHGFSIGWIIQELAGPSLELVFGDLADPALAPLGTGISDAHLLAQLCTVIDAVDAGASAPPMAVNLSLGRFASADESRPGSRCAADRLSCQLTRAIERLAGMGSVVVAAAGNHRAPLYPAVLDAVIDTGALDLEKLAGNATSEPAWETPGAARALFPGDGLCLRGGWSAPAGTSFSSAVLSGWLLGTWVALPELEPAAVAGWSPWREDESCFLLAADGMPLADCATPVNVAAGELMVRTLDPTGSGSPCAGRPLSSEPEADLVVPALIGPMTAPRYISHDLWTASTLGPAPAPDPCVPCSGSGSGGGGGGAYLTVPTGGDRGVRGVRGTAARAAREPASRGASPGGATPTLVRPHLAIDRAASQQISASLHAVYLRVGQSFYQLDLDAAALGRLAGPTVERLILPDARALLEPQRQASLVYVAHQDPDVDCDDPAESRECYWSSSPIDLVE